MKVTHIIYLLIFVLLALFLTNRTIQADSGNYDEFKTRLLQVGSR